MLGPLLFKLRVFLTKQVSRDFMHSFLDLIALGNCPFQHRSAPPFSIVSDLNQVGDAGSQEIRRLFTYRMRAQAMTKPKGKGLLSLLHNPLSPSLMDFPFVTVPV